jgi:hypothetical protein
LAGFFVRGKEAIYQSAPLSSQEVGRVKTKLLINGGDFYEKFDSKKKQQEK